MTDSEKRLVQLSGATHSIVRDLAGAVFAIFS